MSESEALDSILENRDVKVDEKADRQLRESKIRQHLSFVDALKRLNRLDLHDDLTLNDKIHAIAAIKPDAAVGDRQRDFAFKCQAARLQLKCEACLVSGFEKARTKFAVNSDSCPYDLT